MQMLGSTCGFLSYFWPTDTQCTKITQKCLKLEKYFLLSKSAFGVKVSCWMRETLAKSNGFILRLLHNFQTVWTSIFVLLMPFLACSFGALGLLWIWHDVFEVDRIFVDDEAGLSGPISNAIMGFFSHLLLALVYFVHFFILLPSCCQHLQSLALCSSSKQTQISNSVQISTGDSWIISLTSLIKAVKLKAV